MYVLEKKLKDASIAHRLIKEYGGGCKNIHGHTYHFSITVICNSLNEYGMGIDFNDIKIICDNWIQRYWDHVTLVVSADKSFIDFLKKEEMRFFILEGSYDNTTVENMCDFLVNLFWKEFEYHFNNVEEISLTTWETDESSCTLVRKKGDVKL